MFFNLFNTPNRIGKELATLVFKLTNKSTSEGIITHYAGTPEELKRFRFGVAIVNAHVAIWLIKFRASKQRRAESLVEPFYKAYRDTLNNPRVNVNVSSLIPYEKERQFLRQDFKQDDLTTLVSDTWTLSDAIFNLRGAEYWGDICDDVKDMASNPASLGLYRTAKRFATHYNGKEDNSKDTGLLVSLSGLFSESSIVFSTHLSQRLKCHIAIP